MRVRFRITGVGACKRVLTQLERTAPAAAGRALHAETQAIMRVSRSEAPVDTGELRDSAYVDPPRVTSRGASVELGYRADHAAVVHELPGDGRKYLEGPMRRASKGMGGRLAAHMRRDWLGSGGRAVAGAAARDLAGLARRAADFVDD